MDVPFLSLKDVTKQHAEEIHEAVNRVVDSGWYLQGKETSEFEAAYASYIGTTHTIGVANGLDALDLIFQAYIELGVMRAGDEVIVPANTYIASILAITVNGLVPVLVEPNIDTYQLDDSLIEASITSKTKAIMIVHLYGQCGYTDRIGQICKARSIRLIEDNAQAHGCLFRNQKTGSIGEIAGHSFYPGKNLGAFGDAGAVTTSNDALAGMVRMLANYGSKKKYVFERLGRNSRLDEIQAAVLSVKLRHLDADIELRRTVAKAYVNGITNPLVLVPKVPEWSAHVFHIFPVRCSKRDGLQEYLEEKGIHTIIHYPIPPHKQECYKAWNDLSYPVTEKIHREELSLPMSPTLLPEQVQYVISTVNAYV